MLYVYPAIFHHEDDSYWVEFPDLEGCQTFGESLPETMELASDALGVYLAVRLDEGLNIPAPSPLEQIKADEGFATYIYCDANKYRQKTKAVKKTLTVPEWLNEAAERDHVNFSQVLQDALKARLNL